MRFMRLGVVLMAGCLGACATGPNPSDPYEGFNRSMFGFNDGLDRTVLEPAAKGYRAVTNEPIREGVANFVGNLGEPATFANEVLQGRIPNAAGTAGRFVINSTVGVVGIFDPASVIGIEQTREDFGQTMGAWGIPPGPYLVAPLLGSTSPRDLIGFGVNLALNPLNYAQFDGDDAARIGSATLRGLSAREGVIETVTDLRETQVDPYVTVRRFYVRNRATEVANQPPPPESDENVPDFELDF